MSQFNEYMPACESGDIPQMRAIMRKTHILCDSVEPSRCIEFSFLPRFKNLLMKAIESGFDAAKFCK